MLKVELDTRLGDFHLDAAFEGSGAGVTVLFGPSGSGKSSVLAAVAGARRPDSGRIALGDDVLFDSRAGVDLPMERRRIGWVFQDARLFPHLTVEGNLRFGLKRAPAGPIRLEEVVDILGVAALLHRRPRDLSGGERQRVGLGRALLSQPRLLLMDEPLASLDAARRAEILPFFETIKAASACRSSTSPIPWPRPCAWATAWW
ncbi:MAG: ATP-binding cassette domain-containing protein [Caulobacteraceae bacterium]